MTPTPAREPEIFTAALQLPATERGPFLDRACGGDVVLRQRVERLLKAHGEAGDFLESPSATSANPIVAAGIAGEKPGDWIGRYRLLQQIGEGGCGVVYMAEQTEPVRRRVALKIIKPGMDTRSVIARFEAERQALALMDHPHIAKVFDAGATASGRPYFVMELVRGTKITTYCDEHALPTGDRLKLFIQVCQAVQHAHQKGIIHRDLKPSNILVSTTESGAPSPMVIDFGIAKATTNQRLTDKTLFTAFEMLIGTPAYMSPEQAAITGVDVDTRTDIYSLGVLLYELLTGSTPFDGGELLRAGLDEIRRVIRDEEPVRPSARLSKLTRSDLTTVADKRHAPAPTLIRAIRGDLDWIAMKSLEKDRTRRYETASDLARDVQHYLAHEIVSARPPSALYRLRKAIRRNKLLVGSAVTLVALLVASLIVISTSLANERQARREAVTSLEQANQETAKSRQVTAFLEGILATAGPSVAKGRDTALLLELLDRAATRVDQELADQPLVQASLKNTIGGVYQQIGKYDQAEAQHRAALATYRALRGEENREVAATLGQIAMVEYSRDNFAEAEKLYLQSLAMQRKVLGPETAEVAQTLSEYANVLRVTGRNQEVLALRKEALALRQRLLRPDATAEDRIEVLRLEVAVQIGEGAYPQASASLRELIRLQRESLGPATPQVARSLAILGSTLEAEGKRAEAEAAIREALTIGRQVFGSDHPTTREYEYRLGQIIYAQNRFADAEAALRTAMEVRAGLPKESSPYFIAAAGTLGLALQGEGRLEEAEAAMRRAIVLARKYLGDDHMGSKAALNKLCALLAEENRFDEIGRVLDEWQPAGQPPATPSLPMLSLRAQYLAQAGRWAEAQPFADQLVAALPDNTEARHVQAVLWATRGDWVGYEAYARGILGTAAGTRDQARLEVWVRDFLLVPLPGADLQPVRSGVELITAHEPQSEVLALARYVLALWAYRRGDFPGARDHAEKLIAAHSDPYFPTAGQALLALAQQQLGQKAAARAALDQATLALQQLPAPGMNLGDYWERAFIARTLTGEATTLIGPVKP